MAKDSLVGCRKRDVNVLICLKKDRPKWDRFNTNEKENYGNNQQTLSSHYVRCICRQQMFVCLISTR